MGKHCGAAEMSHRAELIKQRPSPVIGDYVPDIIKNCMI